MHTRVSLYCGKVIEAGWLAVVVMVPLWFNIYSARTFEPDKITLMRSIALIMLVAWLIEVAEAGIGRARRPDEASPARPLLQKMLDIPLLLPVVLVVVAYLVSTALSISPTVALWGSYQRLQGTYTALSYIVIFVLIASHLRTRAQLDRLMTTIILTSLPVGLYGIIQRYGLDPLPWAGDVQSRVASSLGNPIFLASYLIMAIPPTLSRLLNSMRAILREEDGGWGHTVLAGVYIFVLAVDVIAVVFSGSRGPMLGLLAGTFFFVLLALLSVYRQRGPADTLTVGEVALCLAETVAPLILGGLAGMIAFAVLGPVTIGGERVDNGAMVALGILGGVALGVVHIALRVVLSCRAWRLWLNWAALAVVMAGFLVTVNLSESPLHSVRSLPTVGRLAQLFQPGEGTGKVRALIWEGVLNLISLDQPLGVPGDYTDSLYRLRPVIGYGPESMFNAFARVYPPELAHVEQRGSSADRSHNETFDFLATLGFLGFVAYYWLIFSLFYYLVKAVGWVPDAAARTRLFILLGAGGLLGAVTPRLVAGSFVFSAVALPAGMIAAVFVYLVLQAFLERPANLAPSPLVSSSLHTEATEEGSAPDAMSNAPGGLETHRGRAHLGIKGQDLVLIGILSALIAHFIEVHFVFSIAATYVHFWVYAGVVVAWLWGRGRGDQVVEHAPVPLAAVQTERVGGAQPGVAPPPQQTDSVSAAAQVTTRRKRRRQRPGTPGSPTREAPEAATPMLLPPEDWDTWLGVFGLTVAIILVAMVFDFVTGQFEISRSSFSLVWLFGITWFVGMAIGLGEVAVHAHAWRKPIRWGRALLLYGITSLGCSFIYLGIHRWQMRPRAVVAADAVQSALQATDVLSWLFLVFYVFVVLLMLLTAAMLAVPLPQRLRSWRPANSWLYLVLLLAAGAAILFKNVDVVRADMVLKQAEQYRNQGLFDSAIALTSRSVELDPDEDFYYLMLALVYQLLGQDSQVPAERRASSWEVGEQTAILARDINRYNPDNSGNLGRWYLTWAQATASDDPAQMERYDKAIEYFENTTYLAPQNVVYYNLWAQVYYILGRYQEAIPILLKSVEIDPQFDQTQLLLGDTYGALGQPEQSAAAHRAAILISPGIFADQFLEQRIDFYRGHPQQLEEIIAAYQDAMDRRPDDQVIPRTLGLIYSRLGDRENAIRYYELAIGRDNADVPTIMSVAAEFLTLEDYARAAEAYQRVLRLEPSNAQAHSNLAYCYARMGRVDEAIEQDLIVLDLTPDDYVSRRNLVLLYRDSGRLGEAIQEAQRLPEVTPANELGPIWMLIGDLYHAASKPVEAIAAYEKAARAAPGITQTYTTLGSLYLQQGQPEEAVRAYRQLAELTPDDYAVHRDLALILRQLGRLDEAVNEANLALGLAPSEQRAMIEQLIADIKAQKESPQP
jgi:tetratricopeptide (TPR) repeat protein